MEEGEWEGTPGLCGSNTELLPHPSWVSVHQLPPGSLGKNQAAQKFAEEGGLLPAVQIHFPSASYSPPFDIP